MPQTTKIPKLPRNIDQKKLKTVTVLMFVNLFFCFVLFFAYVIFYIKSTYFVKHLHRWRRRLSFHLLIFILNDKREVQFFIFYGTIVQISGAKKILFLYHTSLFFAFYCIVPAEFLNCMYEACWVLQCQPL